MAAMRLRTPLFASLLLWACDASSNATDKTPATDGDPATVATAISSHNVRTLSDLYDGLVFVETASRARPNGSKRRRAGVVSP